MENNLIQSVYTILGVAAIIGAFKGIDWLISLKYKTKDDCEKCRNKIIESITFDKESLARLETKVDLLLEKFELKPKED
jgi:hypothetical protein